MQTIHIHEFIGGGTIASLGIYKRIFRPKHLHVHGAIEASPTIKLHKIIKQSLSIWEIVHCIAHQFLCEYHIHLMWYEGIYLIKLSTERHFEQTFSLEYFNVSHWNIKETEKSIKEQQKLFLIQFNYYENLSFKISYFYRMCFHLPKFRVPI